MIIYQKRSTHLKYYELTKCGISYATLLQKNVPINILVTYLNFFFLISPPAWNITLVPLNCIIKTMNFDRQTNLQRNRWRWMYIFLLSLFNDDIYLLRKYLNFLEMLFRLPLFRITKYDIQWPVKLIFLKELEVNLLIINRSYTKCVI